MNCDSFQVILQDLGRGFPLELRTRQEGLAHAEKCPACAARLKDECRLLAGLEAVAASFADIQAPPTVEEALLRAFRKRTIQKGESVQARHPEPLQVSPNRPLTRPSGTLSPVERAVVKKEILSPRPQQGRAERGEGAGLVEHDLLPKPSRAVRGDWPLLVAALALLAISLSAWFSLQRPARRPDQGVAQTKPPLTQKIPPELSSRPLPRVVPEAPKATRNPLVQAESGSSHRPAVQASHLHHLAVPPDLEKPGAQDEAEVEPTEVATEFLPLSYGDPVSSEEGGQLVRIRLPRTTLLTFGFPMSEELAPEPIKADVLLGEDGRARAIRFVH